MKAIMSVTGIDHTGIIAAVSTALAELEVNIINVSQTLMSGYFAMIMELEFSETQVGISLIQMRLAEVAAEQQLVIKVQAQSLFDAMHRL